MGDTPVLIRPARIDDAEDIHAGLLGIAETIGDVRKIKSTVDDIRRFGFGKHPAFQALIAEIGGEFAGMCVYFPIFSTWRGVPGAYLQDLYVAKPFRSRKIGEKLLRAMARQVRDGGGGYIELVADTGNFAAQRFYERLGFTHRDDDQVHRIIGDALDAFIAGKPDGTET